MLRALLLIARWIGLAHDRWRAQVARRRPLATEVDVLHERIERLRSENDLLRSRLRRLPARRRPRYRPAERLDILWHASRYGLSTRATARIFLITVQTLVNWRRDLFRGIGHLVQARSPMNRLPALVEEIVKYLRREWPRWGTRRITGILARLGLKASRTSVQRILRRPSPRRRPKVARHPRPSLRARAPRHVYVIDFTQIGGLFRSVVVGAVLDAFSRKILALAISAGEPDSKFACALLRKAINRHGKPTWILSDRGTQFRARRFRSFLNRRRIRRRFVAVGEPNLARIDRFWRTLKDEYARAMFLYRPIRAIERKLENYVHWYNRHRPNWAIGRRTPDEVHRDHIPRRKGPLESGALSVRLFQEDRRLPVFTLRPAA